MTHPTKAIFGMLLKDSVKVSRGSTDAGLYSEKDVEAALERTELLDFHQTIDVDGIKVIRLAQFCEQLTNTETLL
jgi:cleavage and polyadenylation specificity factor subunit 3